MRERVELRVKSRSGSGCGGMKSVEIDEGEDAGDEVDAVELSEKYRHHLNFGAVLFFEDFGAVFQSGARVAVLEVLGGEVCVWCVGGGCVWYVWGRCVRV